MKRTTHPSVHELEDRTRELDSRIHKLERRGFRMTPHEQEETSRLKRLRLATKDRLAAS